MNKNQKAHPAEAYAIWKRQGFGNQKEVAKELDVSESTACKAIGVYLEGKRKPQDTSLAKDIVSGLKELTGEEITIPNEAVVKLLIDFNIMVTAYPVAVFKEGVKTGTKYESEIKDANGIITHNRLTDVFSTALEQGIAVAVGMALIDRQDPREAHIAETFINDINPSNWEERI
jgi:hypothetical protein